MTPAPPAQVHPVAASPAGALVRAVLALARPDGAIADTPGGSIVNADTNFLYLLAGLAAQAQGDPARWAPVARGLDWLGQRAWGPEAPLPGAFPDALPLEGPGRPLGSPPTAAVGATAARFVALVGALPDPPEALVRSARTAWAGLQRWNWVPGKGLRNAWERDTRGAWSPRQVWYAADQADYAAGRRGALRLGFSPCPRVPWGRFDPTRLALNAAGRPLALTPPEEAAALAILAFDGPPSWRPRLLGRLQQMERLAPGFILPLVARAHLGDGPARSSLVRHLASHPLPRDLDHADAPVYLAITGFVLRLLTPEPNRPR